MVVGLNHRTASVAVRERFWIGESQRYEALRQLKKAEGIEEVLVLSATCRTEFLIWASDPTLAANSLVQYLSTNHGLKLSEWEHFYRRLDDDALASLFRLTSGLEAQHLCESELTQRLQSAWEQARTTGAVGPYLNLVLEKAFAVAGRVHKEIGDGKPASSIPRATLELARRIFGSIDGRQVLLLGAGRTSEVAARLMLENGAASVVVIDQSPTSAEELAQELKCKAATLADRWSQLQRADIVICASGCPHVILTREEAERISLERNRVALLLLDISVPRDVDPEVRRVDGILLYDLDGLERLVFADREIRREREANRSREEQAAAARAEKIVLAEVQAFRNRPRVEGATPTLATLRRSLEQICRQELESFLEERGPFTREQMQLFNAVSTQILQKIATSLVQELKELPEKVEREQMSSAVMRLFHLNSPQAATAGAISGKEKDSKNEFAKSHPVAINY
jgi:glutamyl-tRNA reductase